MTTPVKIAVLGAGSWGTALAILLARNGNQVFLWGRDTDALIKMQKNKINDRYLPDAPFPETLHPVTDLQTALADAKHVLVSVPSHAFADLLKDIKPLITQQANIVWATKGLVPDTGELLSSAYTDIIGEQHDYGILSGPTFAKEVAAGLPTAITLATQSDQLAQDWIKLLMNDRFRVYLNNDLLGVQLGGAVKNVIAVGAGIGDGLGFGANARTALITRGLAEMTRLGKAIGGMPETFYGMTGMGDLLLTCTDDQSRNRRFGLAIGQGKSVTEAEQSIGQVVEAYRNTKEVKLLAEKNNVEMPITEQLYRVLYEAAEPKAMVKELMTRAVRHE